MRYRMLDSDGDMTFGGGQNNFWRDVPQSPAQAVQTRLNLISGEWYLDLSDGTPYQGGILGTGTRGTADSIIRERILGTEGVIEIVEGTYDSNISDSRRLSVRCEINTVYGVENVAV